MSSILRWAETKLEKLDNFASDALGHNPGEDSNEYIEELQNHIKKLQSDMRSLRTFFTQQAQEVEDKYSAQIENLQNDLRTMELSLKQQGEENKLLKEELRSSELKQGRLKEMNDQLLSSMQSNSEELKGSEQEVLEQQVTSLKGLLGAEKLRTEDALREKREQRDIMELERSNLEAKIKDLEEQLSISCKKLSNVQTESSKETLKSENQDMMALSEHLQNKQRTIEGLISERATLISQLEAEKSEKLQLLEGNRVRSTVWQPLSSIPVLKRKRLVRWVVNTVDEGVKEVSDTLQEVALARLGVIVYLVVIHLLLVVFGLQSSGHDEFLSGN